MWSVGINIWQTYFILVEMYLPILGVNNEVDLTAKVGDVEPHIFELLDAEDVSNHLLVQPSINGTKQYLFNVVVGP